MLLRNIAISIFALTAFCTSAMAQEKQVDKLYAFGMASSFNDSTVYITDIQEVSGAYVTEKGKKLVNREEYSYQLRDYLKSKGVAYPTCMTSYALEKKDINKKMERIRKKYVEKNNGRYIVVNISQDEFHYKGVSPEEGVVNVDAAAAEEAARKSSMNEKKQKEKVNNKKKTVHKGKP